MIPRIAHFVFGLREQDQPFHFMHYVALESCRRVLEPERIYLHHQHLPWGPWWDRIRPHLTLIEVDAVEEVGAADYRDGRVPAQYRYAHHADFLRLDALIEHGGVYADIDTIFLRPFPDDLFEAPFVIGRESLVRDEHTGEPRPSLCNALMMAEPGAEFARTWRSQMAGALDGTWSNHSGFLSERLSRAMPSAVRVEPEATFFAFPASRVGLSQLLRERHAVPPEALSVHLWAHLWWDRHRRDFSDAHGERCTPPFLRGARTTLADAVRPYLPAAPASASPARWSYVSLDEVSGYGTAAARCIAALEDSEIEVHWAPFVPGGDWGLGYEPVPESFPGRGSHDRPVIAHLVPEYVPLLRERLPEAFLVAHTVWETDRLPGHWIGCLDAADLVVVPSRFSAQAVAASPVAAPVAVVPHVAPALDARRTASWIDAPADTFVFYTIAEWNERKAVHRTIEAYLRAFTARDPVLLVVKTSPRDWRSAPPDGRQTAGSGTTPWSVAQLLARHPEPPAVKLVTRSLRDSEIHGLHRRGDCFVSLCRSEGWGLGSFDAAAHGNPVVTTGFGGQLDYLAGSPYLVDFELVPVQDPAGVPSYAPDQRWADPDVEHAAALLRELAADRHRAREVAGTLAEDIRKRFGPPAIAATFRAVIDRHHRTRARPDETAGRR